jgi:hypothetical protein
VRGRPVSVRSSSDAEIFFTSVFAIAGVLLVGELLFTLLEAASAVALGPALVARLAPLSTVRLLYASFVLLPAGLAFLAIGLPFCLRTLVAAFSRRLEPQARGALAALAACVVAAIVEVRLDMRGFVALSAAAAVSSWRAHPVLARMGAAHGFRLLAAGGASAAVLAWYEGRMLAHAATSIAVAPTFLVLAAVFAAAGLVTTTAAALRRDGDGRGAVALCWLAALGWLGAPLMRARLAASAPAADRVELWTTATAAIVLCAAALVHRLRA